jgi:hypothetical protein
MQKLIVSRLKNKFPASYGTQNVHYHVHKHSPLDSALISIQSTLSRLASSRFNLTYSRIQYISQVALCTVPSVLPINFLCAFHHLSYACFMPRPYHCPWFGHTKNIRCSPNYETVHCVIFSILLFLPLLWPNILFNSSFSNTFNIWSSHGARRRVLRPYEK